MTAGSPTVIVRDMTDSRWGDETARLLRRTAELAIEDLHGLPDRPVRESASLDELRSALSIDLPDEPEEPAELTALIERIHADAQPGTMASAGPRFFGFVIGGTTAKTVLIRASGPALAVAPFNLGGTMSDPQLSVHGTVNGQDTVLATNAGWGGDPQIQAIANSLYAFGWSVSSKDSAAVVTLAPGN